MSGAKGESGSAAFAAPRRLSEKTCAPELHLGPISSLALFISKQPAAAFSASTPERNRFSAPRSTKLLPWTAQLNRRLSSTLRSNFPPKCSLRNSSMSSKASNETLGRSPTQEKKQPPHNRHRFALLRRHRRFRNPTSPSLILRSHDVVSCSEPLVDIRPELILPHFTKNVQELLADLKGDESVEEYCNVIY